MVRTKSVGSGRQAVCGIFEYRPGAVRPCTGAKVRSPRRDGEGQRWSRFDSRNAVQRGARIERTERYLLRLRLIRSLAIASGAPMSTPLSAKITPTPVNGSAIHLVLGENQVHASSAAPGGVEILHGRRFPVGI